MSCLFICPAFTTKGLHQLLADPHKMMTDLFNVIAGVTYYSMLMSVKKHGAWRVSVWEPEAREK